MKALRTLDKVAREAVAALGLTPVDNFVTIAPDVDTVIIRAWIERGKTFAKLYVDHELIVLAETAPEATRDLLQRELALCPPIEVLK